MPRSYSGLWEQIVSWENLVAAYVNARKGKSTREDVVRFHNDLEKNLSGIRRRLLEDTWAPQPFKIFERITETKRRRIEAPVFEDRVVQHALVRFNPRPREGGDRNAIFPLLCKALGDVIRERLFF